VTSPELTRGFADFTTLLDRLERHHRTALAPLGPATGAGDLARVLDQAVDLHNDARLLGGTLKSYLEAFVATDTFNAEGARRLSELEMVIVRLQQAWTRFQGWLKGVEPVLPAALAKAHSAREHAFILKETAAQAVFLMSEPEEMLAAELSLSGSNAWSKLQRTITSQLSVDVEIEGKRQVLPMPAVITLYNNPSEAVRRQGWEAEMREWKKVKEPLAACLNGVKGSSRTLSRRRGRTDSLHAPVDLARIDRATLDTLLAGMKDSLPLFRRYFKAKARRMGKESLAWWDLFAPSGSAGPVYSWDETRALILETFQGFAPTLHALAQRAFESRWIDAEPRAGKSGGGFCTPIPSRKESRILVNFDGSRDMVSTVAHELGHAYHNDCAFRAGKTELQQFTPMTLAETASIMCESIVNAALLRRAREPGERVAILETELVTASQVIVDIYSRFLFEKELMDRREKAELSADELCDIMGRAQAAAYGDALDERYRHPWMWTWKPHYYGTEVDFYNFPYAFGLLFSTGLYAVYRQRGADFVPDYESLLASTGEATAADLAARFHIDLASRAFWDASIATIRGSIDQYCAL
jgi:pepF/M3 family oligoendopeptidase